MIAGEESDDTHHVQVVGAGDHRLRRRVELDRAAGAVLDVEDEVAPAVGTIAHEGAAGDELRVDADRRNVDAVGAQPVEIDLAEIVPPDAADHAAGLPDLAALIDEDRRRAGRKRADQRRRREEAVARSPSP